MASAVFCVFVQLNVHISFLSGKPIVENSSKIQLLALYYHFAMIACNTFEMSKIWCRDCGLAETKLMQLFD